MRGTIISTIAIAGLLHAGSLFSQHDSVMYTPDFEFVEGIYLTFEEFKNNDPSIRQNAIITDNYSPFDRNIWAKLLDQKEIAYHGPGGDIRKQKRKEVWGYSTGRKVYIRSGKYFSRLFTIGSIMHFMEHYSMPSFKPDISDAVTNQYNIANTNQNNMGILKVGTKTGGSPHMIDYRTGKVLDYYYMNFIGLLERDQELYDEFITIKKYKERTEQMFIFLLRYNERHPVYFPVR